IDELLVRRREQRVRRTLLDALREQPARVERVHRRDVGLGLERLAELLERAREIGGRGDADLLALRLVRAGGDQGCEEEPAHGASVSGYKERMERRVVIIEDERDVARLLEFNLRGASYVVDSATTGAEGLALVKAKTPDVVILDLMLPDQSGYDVCK